MGKGLLAFYKNKIKKEYKLAFFMAFLFTIIIHAYKFVNYIPNIDSIYNYYYNQDVTQSGRWALGLACSISSYFDLSWVIGLLSSVYIGLTTATIVAIFKMKNPVVIGITAGLLASSPCTIDTFHYLYTADGYLLGLFLATLSVYLSRLDEKRLISKIISIVLLCLSCAIYQANISFALLLTLCSLIQIVLDNKNKKEALKWIIEQIIIYVLSLALYYIIWKLIMEIRNLEPYYYLGIQNVGNFGLDYIKHGFVSSYQTFVEFFFLWNIKEYGLVQYNIYSILFIISLLGILVFVFIKNKVYKRKWALITFIITIFLIIPSSSFWYFTSLELYVHNYLPKMLYGLIVLYIFTIVLFEKYASVGFKNILGILMILIIFYNFILANVSYFCMETAYERTFAEANDMNAKINEVVSKSDEEVTEIVIVGNRMDDNTKIETISEDNELIDFSKYKIVLPMAYKLLTLDAKRTFLFLKTNFDLPYILMWDDNYLNSYLENEEVKVMGAWPADDSVKIVDGKVILKLSEQ